VSAPTGRKRLNKGLAVAVGMRHFERIREVADFTDGAGLEEDFNDVESNFDLGVFEQAQIIQAGAGEASAASGVNSGGRARPFF